MRANYTAKATLIGLPPGVLGVKPKPEGRTDGLMRLSDVTLHWSAKSEKAYEKMQLISSTACRMMLSGKVQMIVIGRKRYYCYIVEVTPSAEFHRAHLAVRVRLSGRTKI